MNDQILKENGGSRVFKIDNDYLASQNSKYTGVCGAYVVSWMRRILLGKADIMDDRKSGELGALDDITKVLAIQQMAEKFDIGGDSFLYARGLNSEKVKGSPASTVKELLPSLKGTSGFYYYVTLPTKGDGPGHAMGFFMKTDQGFIYFFMEPNIGLYAFTNFDDLCKGVVEHIQKWYGGERIHHMRKVVNAFKRNDSLKEETRIETDKDVFSLTPVIQSLKLSSKDAHEIHWAALAAHWFKRCENKDLDEKKIIKFSENDDLGAIKKLVKDNAKILQTAQVSERSRIWCTTMFSSYGVRLTNPLKKLIKLSAKEQRLTQASFGSMSKWIIENLAKPGSRIVIYAEGDYPKDKWKEMGGNTRVAVLAIAYITKQSAYYLLDPTQKISKIALKNQDDLKKRLCDVFGDCISVAYDAYSFE